jgi:signal transduction histidine kinase
LLVEGDPLHLEQVLQNLVQNAIKYSPEGEPVTVRLQRRDGVAAIDVVDQGIGIPAEAIPRLFQRFFRAANSAQSQTAGMGIGLYIVHEIVTRHRGTIEVCSQEGKGSTFTVCLPLSEQESVA